ncbi:MAG: DNA/RNA non-specific endonuclease [Bacteroides sp.]
MKRKKEADIEMSKKLILNVILILSLFIGGCAGKSGGQDISNIPEYSGEPYTVVNGNRPDFSDSDKQSTEAFEYYSDLDYLGRCGQAYANICAETRPTKEREPIGNVKPSGWQTVKYSGLVDGNYLYNRCHLIGYQLTGENANEKNLITGTRYMNINGMLHFEEQVDSYVDDTGNHVLYRVTPVFAGKNLVASGVQIEAWSVEDKGEGVCFNVYCYNVQPGIEIDYATGDSHESENAYGAAGKFILNTNTKKFHIPSCSTVSDIAQHNKKTYSGTIEELKKQGYSPCKRCLGKYQ